MSEDPGPDTRTWNVGGAEVRLTLPAGASGSLRRAWEQATGAADRGSGRARAGAREPLSVQRIVDVAIAQMREVGYDAVTMRSLAKELGTGPASLYAHVANRAELDALVVDRVSAQVRVPDPDPEHWDDQLRAMLHDMLRVFREHPGAARASLGMIPVQPGALVAAERTLALLKAGDVPDQYAAWAVDMFSLFVASVAVEEDIWRQRADREAVDTTEEAVVEQVRELFLALPAEHFPLLNSLARPLTAGSGDDRFGFGVELLVAGLKAMSTRDAD